MQAYRRGVGGVDEEDMMKALHMQLGLDGVVLFAIMV
jgi:hypothetical protein